MYIDISIITSTLSIQNGIVLFLGLGHTIQVFRGEIVKDTFWTSWLQTYSLDEKKLFWKYVRNIWMLKLFKKSILWV